MNAVSLLFSFFLYEAAQAYFFLRENKENVSGTGSIPPLNKGLHLKILFIIK